ncbi:MAG: cytidine deaminase [Verrucomicrobia bacterium]|nr:MAG: cytidine deaminase [Verrucomicrobiota bacterium]
MAKSSVARSSSSAAADRPAPLPLARLKRAARAAADFAYAPYSKFRVGAAIWTDQGLFSGCNVENASYGLCNCAERTAIFSAAAGGARRLSCVVVYTPTSGVASPCGACRQVIHEFGPEARVISICDSNDTLDTNINALLPGAFGPADLGIEPPRPSSEKRPAKGSLKAR